MPEREPRHGLARVISTLGIASRTQATTWIPAGRATPTGPTLRDAETPSPPAPRTTPPGPARNSLIGGGQLEDGGKRRREHVEATLARPRDQRRVDRSYPRHGATGVLLEILQCRVIRAELLVQPAPGDEARLAGLAHHVGRVRRRGVADGPQRPGVEGPRGLCCGAQRGGLKAPVLGRGVTPKLFAVHEASGDAFGSATHTAVASGNGPHYEIDHDGQIVTLVRESDPAGRRSSPRPMASPRPVPPASR